MVYIMTALMLFFLGGCGASSGGGSERVYEVANGYTGILQNSDAFMTLLVSENSVSAYVCDGDEGIQQWFDGNISDPLHFTLANANAAAIQARFIQDHFEGNVTVGGMLYPFSLRLNGNDRSGIYRVIDENATNDGIVAGWIVDEADNVRGAMTINGSFVTAGPLPQTNLVYRSKTYSVFRIRLAASDGNPLPPVIVISPPSPPAPGVPVPYPNIGTTAK